MNEQKKAKKILRRFSDHNKNMENRKKNTRININIPDDVMRCVYVEIFVVHFFTIIVTGKLSRCCYNNA